MASLDQILVNRLSDYQIGKALNIITDSGTQLGPQRTAWALARVFISGTSSVRTLTPENIRHKVTLIVASMYEDDPTIQIDEKALVEELINHYIYEGDHHAQ